MNSMPAVTEAFNNRGQINKISSLMLKNVGCLLKVLLETSCIYIICPGIQFFFIYGKMMNFKDPGETLGLKKIAVDGQLEYFWREIL